MTTRRTPKIKRLQAQLGELREENALLIAVADAVRDALFAESDEEFGEALDAAFDAVAGFDLQPQPCTDCGFDTFSMPPDDASEYYMVHANIWRLVTRTTPASMLCVGCLENRLGRRLTSADFVDAPINDPDKSDITLRLRSRLLASA